MSIFDQRKTKILQGLASDEPDLSPKGKPDEQIIELLQLLNAHEKYVTTSSCSGRAVIYLDADKSTQDKESRGRWLMNEHSPFQITPEEQSLERLYKTFFSDFIIAEQGETDISLTRLVTFKFEPLILHVLCRDIPAACRLLQLATISGYRESGISISSPGTAQEKVLVAIRTSAIRLDIPLAAYNTPKRSIIPFGLTKEYLTSLLKLVNEKFADNESRKIALFAALQADFGKGNELPKESKEERRARKRMEGLKLQEAINSERNTHREERD